MISLPTRSDDAADPPATAEEIFEALESWNRLLSRHKGGAPPLRVRRAGDVLTMTADVDRLRGCGAAIECGEAAMTLRVRSRELTIPLLCFEVSSRLKDHQLAIVLTPRSTQALLARLSIGPNVPAGDFSRNLFRMLDAGRPTGVRGALVTRLMNALAEAATDVDDRAAADAVAQSSDALAVVRLLEQPDVLARLRAADPLAPARLRGVAARQTLLDLAGGTFSSEETASALGLTRQAVEKRRRAGRLLALSFGKRGYRYPAFQFADGRTITGLEPVLAALKDHDAWTQLSFFLNRRSDVNDETPLARLIRGDVDRVQLSALALGEHGAA